MKIAVVGAGPKGLFAAERVLAHRSHAPTQLTVFDPSPPGEGAAYDRDQPAWLRLNVTAGIVDAGWHEGPAPSDSWLVNFDDWRRARGEGCKDRFPPRRQVGNYLAWVWTGLVGHAPASVRLAHRAERVDRISRGEQGWLVAGERFDEVLLASGHAHTWDGSLGAGWHGPERLLGSVFPVRCLDEVGAGQAVALRGAALTFIDAALALTEGRGGRFEPTDHGYLYRPGGLEPRVIWPTSRSGRWMEVKPVPGSDLDQLPRQDLVLAGQDAVLTAETVDAVMEHVLRAARALLHRSNGHADDSFDELVSGRVGGDPTAALSQSWEVATGRRPPGSAWALGQAWRDLYPALARRFAGTHADVDFAAFRTAAVRFERLAFGPPPVNAAKLLALIRAGVVDPSSLDRGRVDGGGFSWKDGSGPSADVVVDAVLPPPGVPAGSDGPASCLVREGVAFVPAGRRGLAIAPDGNCLQPDGRRIPGLSAIGRVTEDVTIGNDTLNRSLHDTTERWALALASKEAP